MTNLDFVGDPSLFPKAREEIQIEEITLVPYSDGRRVRVEMRLTPFIPADRPSLDITVQKDDGSVVVSTRVIETMQYAPAVTIHLQSDGSAQGIYTFRVDLFFGNKEVVQHSVSKVLALPAGDASGEAG
ncbi:MAG: hypothetical protein QXP01_04130 [Candidatus Hadarchaeum sp.]